MKSSKSCFQFKLTLGIFLMGFHQLIIGCSYVFSSMLFAQLRNPNSSIKLSTEESSWVASVPILVCSIGLSIVGISTDVFGRRKALQLSYIPLIISWLILAFADSYETILIGRIFLGTTFGAGTCVFVYVAEVSPASQRPFYNALITVLVGVGNVTMGLLAKYFHWNAASLILAVASAAGCLALFYVPEPPMWLRARNRTGAAERAERWYRREFVGGTPAAGVAVTDASAAATPGGDHRDGVTAAPVRGWSAYAHPTVWKPTLITFGFFVCQQCSGYFVLLFYSVDVLRDFNVAWDGITVTVFLFGTRMVSSVIYASLHRVNRKTLAVASCTGMTVSMLVILAYTIAFDGYDRPPFGFVVIAAFALYVFSGQIGMLPMPWTLCGEVFPMAVKGTINGIVQTCGYLLMFVVIKIYPIMVSILGIQLVWTIFTFNSLLSAFFCLFLLPETKGVPLDVILNKFEGHRKSKINLP